MPPYEFCASKFLDLWRAEQPLHEGMQGNPSGDLIRQALKHFSVARTFKGLSDDGCEQISRCLVEVSTARKGSPSDRVIELARRFKECFDQFNLSAASKLLWLRDRSPYLLYDMRAVTALGRLGNKFKKADYRAYFEIWTKEYEKRRRPISDASRGLVALPKNYTAAFYLVDDELAKIVHEPWFCERVFDIYLWELGVKDPSEN